MTDLEQAFRLNSDVRFRTVDQEGVVLRQEEGEILVVNPVGARILELIGDAQNLDQILDVLQGEFDVELEQLKHDVPKFLGELVEAGVLGEVEG